MTLKFRTDIQGLRALAVLSVVLFHAGVSYLPGGFTGVDVFFTISGFLITSIIVRDLEKNEFSILEFYKRRISRIFPALFAMLALTIFVGMISLMPSELRDLGQSSAAAAGFVSNIYFWKTTGYFDGSAEVKAVLHTWSLGVEEQFYIFWPVIVSVIFKYFRNNITSIFLLIIATSFSLALIVGIDKPQMSFYLLPMRAWELAIGGLVALGGAPRLKPPIANAAAIMGIGLIVGGVLLIDETMPFPAPWAVVPCLGVALLLAYGERAVTARLLNLKPVQWIGGISYSLYLWHWPIIVYYRIETGHDLTPIDTAILTFASLIFAAASFRFIEGPFQNALRLRSRNTVALGGAASLIASVAIFIFISNISSSIHPLTPNVRQVASLIDYTNTQDHTYQFRPGSCFQASDTTDYDFYRCTSLDKKKPNYVLIGDSFGAQYWRALSHQFPSVNIVQATASGCLPVEHPVGSDRCKAVVSFAYSKVVPKATGVILAGRWTEKEIPALIETIRMLRKSGKTVTVIGPSVEYNGDFPILLARAIERGEPDLVSKQMATTPPRVNAIMTRAVRAEGANFYSPLNRECGKVCVHYSPNGRPLHFDYGHFTYDGAKWILADLKVL